MRWDKLTIMSQEAFQMAQTTAEEMGHQEVRPEHLLWSFLNQEENVVLSVLGKLEVNLQGLRSDLQEAFDRLPKVSGGEVFISSSLRQVMTNAQKEAEKLKD